MVGLHEDEDFRSFKLQKSDPLIAQCNGKYSLNLLLIVVLAVEESISGIAGASERAEAHGALHARLVPGPVVHP